MLSVALPALLVATGFSAGGVPELTGALVSVPQTWAVPAARLTLLIE